MIYAIPLYKAPKISELVIDANLNMGTMYKILARYIQAPPGQTMYLLDYDANTHMSVGGGGISIDHIRELTSSHGVVFQHLANFNTAGYVPAALSRVYGGNAGTEVYQSFFPANDIYSVLGTTFGNSGIKIRIPDMNLPEADLKFRALMKCGGAYTGTCRIYVNGGTTAIDAITVTTHTVLQWCNFSANCPISAGDLLEFYCANANAGTTTMLYELQILGTVGLRGLLNEETTDPAVA